MLKATLYTLGVAASALLLWLSITHRIENGWTEVVAFITGAWCVWLTVKEHIWNWPIGIANCVFSLVVFWEAGLLADSILQVVYIILSALGWYWWLFGGKDRTTLHVDIASPKHFALALLAGVVATLAWWPMLIYVHDSAPLFDSFTTALSLVAQYLLTRKYLQNWSIWILVDVIYVPLYAYRHLYLMSTLYAVFLILATMGYIEWKRTYQAQIAASPEPA